MRGSLSQESEGSGKLSLYGKLKLFLCAEPYVTASLSVGVRRVMAGLSAGCLPLQIELGRYTQPKTPIQERICRLCHVELEDQQHFLLRCKCIKDARVKLLQKVLNASEFSSSSWRIWRSVSRCGSACLQKCKYKEQLAPFLETLRDDNVL